MPIPYTHVLDIHSIGQFSNSKYTCSQSTLFMEAKFG